MFSKDSDSPSPTISYTTKERSMSMTGSPNLPTERLLNGDESFNDTDHLKDWGFDDMHCHCCGALNSEVDGLLMQCARCKKAYYCSSKCFNEHLPVHQKLCPASGFLNREPIRVSDSVLEDIAADVSSQQERRRSTTKTGMSPKSLRKSLKEAKKADAFIAEEGTRNSNHSKRNSQKTIPSKAKKETTVDTESLRALNLDYSDSSESKTNTDDKQDAKEMDSTIRGTSAHDKLHSIREIQTVETYPGEGQIGERSKARKSRRSSRQTSLGSSVDNETNTATSEDDVFSGSQTRSKSLEKKRYSQKDNKVANAMLPAGEIQDFSDISESNRSVNENGEEAGVFEIVGGPIHRESEAAYLRHQSTDPAKSGDFLMDAKFRKGKNNDVTNYCSEGAVVEGEKTSMNDAIGKVTVDETKFVIPVPDEGKLIDKSEDSTFDEILEMISLEEEKETSDKSDDDTIVEYVYEYVYEYHKPDKTRIQDEDQDEFLLVLYASRTPHEAEVEDQRKAFQLLHANGISFRVIDGKDPNNAKICDELFDISGHYEEYPQFFKVRKNGSADFLGKWEEFDEKARDALKQTYSGASAASGASGDTFPEDDADDQADSLLTFSDRLLHRKKSIWRPTEPPKIILPPEDDERPDCPTRTDTDDSESFLVLYASETSDEAALINQQKMVGILGDNDIRFDVLDGKNPEVEETRDALFELSGSPDVYPQFFKGESDGLIKFWGGWTELEKAAKTGSLTKKRSRRKHFKRLALPLEALMEEDEEEDLLIYRFNASLNNCDASPRRPIRRSSFSSGAGSESENLLVLYTSETQSREELVNQQMMVGILADNNIVYEAIDARDPANEKERDELLLLSGGVECYPQFFKVGADGTTFLGGLEELEKASREGSLRTESDRPLNAETGVNELEVEPIVSERVNELEVEPIVSELVIEPEIETIVSEPAFSPEKVEQSEEDPCDTSDVVVESSAVETLKREKSFLRKIEVQKKEYTWTKPEWALGRNLRRFSEFSQSSEGYDPLSTISHKPKPPSRRQSSAGETSITVLRAFGELTPSESLRSSVTLREAAPVKKEYGWKKPEWVMESPLKKKFDKPMSAARSLSLSEHSKPRVKDWTPEGISLNHTQPRKSVVEPNVPEWARKSPLRTTSKGKVLQTLGDLVRDSKPRLKEPEWVKKSPLRQYQTFMNSLSPSKSPNKREGSGSLPAMVPL